MLVYQGIKYPNYKISDTGIIKNQNNYELKRNLEKRDSIKTEYFYSTISLGKRHSSKRIILHRAVAETFIQNKNNYKYVIFRDNNFQNISVDNLFWSNHKTNGYEEHKRKLRSKAVSKKRKKIKEKAIEYKGGKCVICGYNKCQGALEFHHIDTSKKNFSISSTGMTRSWEKIKIELDKCICVCANCHREIHSGLIIL